MSLIALDVVAATDLVATYRQRSSAVVGDAEVLARNLPLAADFATSADAASAIERVPRLLTVLAEQLVRDADDLAWRVAYVEAMGSSDLPPSLPDRHPGLADQSIADLLDQLGRSEHHPLLAGVVDAIVAELSIRSLLDPDTAEVIARRIDPELAASLRELVEDRMVEAVHDWRRSSVFLFGDADDALLAAQGDGEAITRDWGVLLGALSHTPSGAELLDQLFAIDAPDRRTQHLPVALLHGVWDEELLVRLADRYVTTDLRMEHGFTGPPAPLETMVGADVFPRLVDPHAVLLEAIARNPAAVRRFVFDDDGYRRIMEATYWGGFVAVGTRMRGGSRRDDAAAAVLEAALLDPDRADAVYDFLLGDGTGELGLIDQVVDLGVPGDETRRAFAAIWNVQWSNLAHPDPSRAVAPNHGGALLAEVFEDEQARAEVVAGFAGYLEVLYGSAFQSGDPAALDAALEGAFHGFQSLDHALDELEPSVEDRGLLRRAFQSGLGHGVKQALPWVGVPAGWPAVAASFVAGELISAGLSDALPDEHIVYPSSQSLLEDLFIDGDRVGTGRARQPSLGRIMLANAALTAMPVDAAAIPPSPYLVDGTIVVPDDLADHEAFGVWFNTTFGPDSAFWSPLDDSLEALAGEAATVSTPS